MSNSFECAGYIIKHFQEGKCVEEIEVDLSFDKKEAIITIGSSTRHKEVEITVDIVPALIDKLQALIELANKMEKEDLT
jgi:hypothetical protein